LPFVSLYSFLIFALLFFAGATDYGPSNLFFFLSNSPADNPLLRRSCFSVTASGDGILEDTEEVDFGLILQGSSTSFLLLQPNETKLQIFDQSGKYVRVLTK